MASSAVTHLCSALRGYAQVNIFSESVHGILAYWTGVDPCAALTESKGQLHIADDNCTVEDTTHTKAARHIVDAHLCHAKSRHVTL